MPKYLRKQAKEMVAALITFFERERDSIRIHGQPLISFETLRECVAAALNISISSVSAISEATKNNELLSNPKANRQKPKPVLGIDDATKSSIRNVIHEIYRNRIILKEIGFRWRKDDSQQGLVELLTRIDRIAAHSKC